MKTFQAKGYPVYYLDWVSIWSTVANEYSSGDMKDGYVYETNTKISYPKFHSPSGKYYISLRSGIWDVTSKKYDVSRLCIMDFPVLKAHSLAGATVAIKNWIGVLTTYDPSNLRYGGSGSMHSTYFLGKYALVARVMAVTFPKLTIVDATWTTTMGPSNLNYVVNTKTLVSSTDPVAASWYAAKYILTPIARYPNQTNPDLGGGTYNTVLNNWTTFLRDSAGLSCTKNASEISVYDRKSLLQVSIDDNSETNTDKNFYLSQNYPNPFNPITTIKYQIPKPVKASITIYNILGQEIKTLVNKIHSEGSYEVQWDGRDTLGRRASSGIYIYRFETINGYVIARKMVLLK